MIPGLQLEDELVASTFAAAKKSAEALLSLQSEQGYWWAELTADTTLESDYILLQLWLHQPHGAHCDKSPPRRPYDIQMALLRSLKMVF